MPYSVPPKCLLLVALLVAAVVGCDEDGGGITEPETGTLEIQTSTSGESVGYTVSLDGGAPEAIGANGTLTKSDLAPGSHVVELVQLPSGCTVQGERIRTVTISAGATARVSFQISCVPPAGTIEVITATAGPAPATYTLLMDGTSLGFIGASATRQLADVPAGDHSIGLSDVPANCQLQGDNPRPVTLAPGAAVTVEFTLTCTSPPAQTGTLGISTATTGSSPDPDGYRVLLDGGAPQPIAVTGSISLANVAVGNHSVRLSGVAPNCAVTGANPQNVSVAAGATASVSFTVTCGAPPSGSLSVVTATSGSNPDPDGYTFAVDDQTSQPIGASATVVVENLPAGSHEVTLSGVAPNCVVEGENPRTVQVQAGSTSSVQFSITCAAPPSSDTPIAFSSVAPGLQAIFVVNPDGTGLRNLTPAGDVESSPIWSPDGSKILFARRGDLYVMNGDGTERVELANTETVVQYRWSPDGQMIAFVDVREVAPDDFVTELWVMQADGSGKLMLAANASSPTWSPDRRLAYEKDLAIRVVNADGSGDRQLTPAGTQAFQPAWSPDGAQIAFVTLSDKQIFLINPDGTGLVDLTPPGSMDDTPTWSADGSRIGFTTSQPDQPLNSEIAVMNRDGSGRTNLTSAAWFEISPAWSPDGQKIVFVSSNENSEIFVMNADGSGQINISNRPESEDTEPDWARGEGSGSATALKAAALKYRKLNVCRWCAS